jgi:hypothetical protein
VARLVTGKSFAVRGNDFRYALKVPRGIFAFLILSIVTCSVASFAASPNLYPNEIKGFRFYAKYLAPLRPYTSNKNTVISVFGSDEGLQLTDWRIVPLYSCPDPSITCPNPDRLASIEVLPRGRVSMLGMKFPPAFIHSYGGVSEINVTCDVYKDGSGLKYWVYSEDFASGKKGDLLKIEYGPSKQIRQKTVSLK